MLDGRVLLPGGRVLLLLGGLRASSRTRPQLRSWGRVLLRAGAGVSVSGLRVVFVDLRAVGHGQDTVAFPASQDTHTQRRHTHTITNTQTLAPPQPAALQTGRDGQDVLSAAESLTSRRGECPTLTRTGRLWVWSVREKKKKDVPLTSSTEQTEDTRPNTARRRPQDLGDTWTCRDV